jgi:DNA-binding CsgD family transcriptional regulator/PAS domain-containing protein
LDHRRWFTAVDNIRQELRFGYAVLGVYPLVPGEITLGVSSGIEAVKLEELAGLGDDILELWGGNDRISRFPLEEPIVQSEAVSAAALQSSRFFNAWAQPQGIVDAVAIGLERNSRMVSTLSFGWHRDAGALGTGEIEGLRLLAPHFRRAIAISQLLESRSIAASNLTGVLEGLAAGVIVVDELMSLLHANPAAEAMLTQGDTVRVTNGRVTVNTTTSDIEDAVAQAGVNEVELGRRGGRGFAARGPLGEPRIVHVLPLRGREPGQSLFRRATAALFITQPDHEIDLPREAFAALYGLTPAETRIVELLVGGAAPPQIASELGLLSSTVKTHLQRVFEKTGVHRQSDLIRLAASLSVSHRR